jgi:phosphate transport system substrate-binding protein
MFGCAYRVSRLLLVSLLSIVLLLFVACRATPTPVVPAHYRIGTADSTQYIAREAANAFRREHPSTTFDFFTNNSTMALRQLAFDQFDFAFIARNPRADELDRAHATALQLGRDGVYVIVHPSNSMEMIAREDLRKILTGEFNNWSQLGIEPPEGRDDIQVLMREEGAGMRTVMEENVLQGGRVTPTALLLPTNLDMLAYVAEHPNSIGYVAANVWDDNSQTKPLGIDGVPAVPEEIAAGTYPLQQTIFLVVPQEPNSEISTFIDFLAGEEGRETLYQRISQLAP